ncbi:hypothetical protein [Salininema proteolyticum]|uniref:Uncharacterized protein n=1 Tax=Salininema proteolyticum TaxID=1607685 RepID=A0ABV8TZ17_9ACTN
MTQKNPNSIDVPLHSVDGFTVPAYLPAKIAMATTDGYPSVWGRVPRDLKIIAVASQHGDEKTGKARYLWRRSVFAEINTAKGALHPTGRRGPEAALVWRPPVRWSPAHWCLLPAMYTPKGIHIVAPGTTAANGLIVAPEFPAWTQLIAQPVVRALDAPLSKVHYQPLLDRM